ncbi:MAG: lysophospholipid acyltransferase family protein [Propioniciclava sp.]|uniref:lysophospholipid acyltransferase family protein n=1 Tax=Propioniciclava sp. TaxID=2038686 RepID=UPI0039E4EF54
MALLKRRANRSQSHPATPSAPGDSGVYRGLARVAGFAYRVLSDEIWDDAAALPADGGVIVVSNHLSYADPVAVGRYLIWSGRWPRYLGKSELWKLPVIGWLARSCRQIPVFRDSARAKDALSAAEAALAAGECVAIYPEGGRSRDPEQWPQASRTGVGRLALTTGVPVIPVANWGAQYLIAPKARASVGLRRPRIEVIMGEPVDLSDLAGRHDARAAREATDRIMAAVTELVEQLRGEKAPDTMWDQRRQERVPRRY